MREVSDVVPEPPGGPPSVATRDILRLAVPAFAALTAEPLLLLIDSAIVGHLGTRELAALGVAAVVLQTLVGLCVFLAFGTTSSIARLLGAREWSRVGQQAHDALWLAAILGAVLAVGLVAVAPTLTAAMIDSRDIASAAADYLRISAVGVPAMLVVLAATGVLRGCSDARTPLLVIGAASLVNAGLSYLFVYAAGLGLPGSALGTVIAQWIAAIWLVVATQRRLPAGHNRWRPVLSGVTRTATLGLPILIRTVLLRAGLFLTALAAARLGGLEVATHQVAMGIWTFFAYALDSLAIAAQTLVGGLLGAGQRETTRTLLGKLMRWAFGFGVVTGGVLLALAPLAGGWFSDDPQVRSELAQVLIVAAVFQPLAALVFLLDGVLLGAGDNQFLAWAGILPVVLLGPGLLWAPTLIWVWIVFGVGFVGGRLAPLWWRARGTKWMLIGADAVRGSP